MKKVLLAIATTLTLLLGSVALPSPATAAVAPASQTFYFTVGETVSLDLGCDEPNVISVFYTNGSYPDGLSMDNFGLVTGTPTTVGTWTLSEWNCTYNGGSNGGSVPSASVTFQINPIVTPLPTLRVLNLNTLDCSFHVSVLFPKTPDPATGFVEISNNNGLKLRSNTTISESLASNVIYSRDLTLTQLNNDVNFFGGTSTTVTGTDDFTCGNLITVTAGYQFNGAPVATSSESIVPTIPTAAPNAGGAPTQALIALDNDQCEFRVIAALPSDPQPGSTKITLNLPNAGVNQLTFTIDDEVAKGIMDFTFDPESLSAGPITKTGIVSEDYQVSTPWACGDTIYVSVDYRDLQGTFWTSTWNSNQTFGVTPTRPSSSNPNEFTISAVQVEGACNIRVVTKTPNEARPIAIVIREIDPVDPGSGMDWITGVIITQPASDNGVITANLSFASKDAITVSVPVLDEDKIFTEARECSGSFLAAIDYPGGTLASTLITLGKVMPTCNAGSILVTEDAECVPVLRGFYTTELNSSTPIACPKGMTTATTASKSVNDCYKPIVQTITGFKAPKPMKFGKSTNIAITTNTKAIAKYKAVGPCKAKVANVVSKVKGKKVTTKMLKVTASKKAGLCSVTLTSEAKDKYLALSKVVKIKVSKSGK